MGKEWSCYNGAVRLFWPMLMNRDDFRAHPLWTYDYLMRGASDEIYARERFRGELVEQLVEASTFVADDLRFSKFETEVIKKISDESRAVANANGDFEAIASLYAVENDELRARIDLKEREAETLQENIDALAIALRSKQSSLASNVVPEIAPDTVFDAVQIARKETKDFLQISNNVDQQILDLSINAGPPEKVLRYLRSLKDLSECLSRGTALGKSIPMWLREKNVECSVESETTNENRIARKKRTFNIDGNQVYCEYHAKPSDNVSPNMCVRIYFAISDSSPHVVVGYIGRHFD
jgi:valyl-tRNA synthetase